MPQRRPADDPVPSAERPPRDRARTLGDRPKDHHPPDTRSPDEYTEPPGSHRREKNGPATDVGA